MAERTIPLPAGQAHLRFRVQLANRQFRLRLDWLERFGYFVVRLEEDDELLTAGRALHPEMDLLRHLKLGVGRLYLRGRPATVDNLGVRNRLIHEEPDDD